MVSGTYYTRVARSLLGMVVAAVLVLTGSVVAMAATIVTITDDALRGAITGALGFDPGVDITDDAAQTLTELDASALGVESLSGLEAFTNLKKLHLSNNRISDLTPIKNLTHLSDLKVSGQSLTAASVDTGVDTANPVKSPNGAPVAVSSAASGFAYDASANTWSFLNPGTNLQITWSKSVTVGGATATFSGAVTQSITGDAIVFISVPDENLKAAINLALNQGPADAISEAQAATIPTLNASSRTISDLTGIQHLTGLSNLNLANNQISDITALQGLTNLTSLDLSGNRIIDPGKISGLTNLTTLKIDNQTHTAGSAATGAVTNTPIKNLTGGPVAVTSSSSGFWYDSSANGWKFMTPGSKTLAWNTSLTVGGATAAFKGQISQTITGSAIPLVTVPDVNLRNAINSALGQPADAPITEAQASNLSVLKAGNAGISSLTGLEAFTGLTELDLSRNNISNLGPLSGLEGLTKLNLAENKISNVKPLESLTDLRELNLAENKVSNIVHLTALTAMKTLDLSGNSVSDIVPLTNFTDLTVLELDGNNVTQLGPLYNLGKLHTFNAADNNISEIGTLANLTALVTLGLAGNNVADISDLGSATKLVDLDLAGNNVSNLAPLKTLTKLESLDLSGNAIMDLTPIASLSKLTSLDLSGQTVTLPSAETGEDVANPVKSPNGDVVEVTGSGNGFAYSRVKHTWSFLKPGTNLTLSWASSVSIGSVSSSFTGTITQTITGEALDPPEELPIDDLKLLAELNKELKRPEGASINATQALEITELSASNKGIERLGGLEYFTNLVHVDLSKNHITNITPLQGLGQIQTLDLSGQTLTLPAVSTGTPTQNPVTNFSGAKLPVESEQGGFVYNNNTHAWSFTEPGLNRKITWDVSQNEGALVFSGTITQTITGQAISTINIPDAKLRATINSALGQSSGANITTPQALTLTTLDAGGKGITNLSGLEHFTNLRTIDLFNNDVSDLGPLSDLTKLTDVDVSWNEVGDLAPLEGLTNLSRLVAAHNRIRSVEPLSEISSLKFLYLDANRISNIEPLDGLTLLQELNLSANRIADLQPLAGMVNLSDLKLENQAVSVDPVDAGIATANPLRNIDGSKVTVSSKVSGFSYNASAGTWIFSKDGKNRVITWNVKTSGSPKVSFTGTITQTVIGKQLFKDVPKTHDFYDEITWLAANGITTGYDDGTFKPRNQITREAMAAFLYRFEGEPAVDLPEKSPFKDVPKSHAFYKEIVWLSQSGITTGYDDGTFKPRNKITREAMAAFLYRFESRPVFTPPGASPFKDVPTDHTFYREITWLAANEITTGYDDGTFKPRNKITREASAAFLYRVNAL